MKVFIAAAGKDLDSMVADRFARCPVIMGIESETSEILEAIDNPYKDGTGGVGVKVANHIIQNGYKAAIGPQTGPNATSALKEGGIELFTFQGTIRDALEAFNKRK